MTFEHRSADCGTHSYTEHVTDTKPGHITIECPDCGMDGVLTKSQVNQLDGVAPCGDCDTEVEILQ